MKAIKFLLSGLICMLSISCSAQRTFSDVASIKGVTSVFVGKTMLRLAGASMDFNGSDALESIDIGRLIKDLDSIEIIECDKDSMEKVKKMCKKILSDHQFEILTDVIQDDQKVEISGIMNKDGQTMNMLLISVAQPNQLVYILMKGKINIDALSEALQDIR